MFDSRILRSKTRKTNDGRYIFFPNGIKKSGYVLLNDYTIKELDRFYKISGWINFIYAIAISFLASRMHWAQNSLIISLCTALLIYVPVYLYERYFLHRTTSGLPQVNASDLKLSELEEPDGLIDKMLIRFSPTSLCLCICCIILFIPGLFLIIDGVQSGVILNIIIGSTVISSILIALTVYSYIKKKSKMIPMEKQSSSISNNSINPG